MTSVKIALRALRELGPKPVALYAAYQVLLRSGWLRRQTPQYDWQTRPLAWWLRAGVPSEPDDYRKLRHRNRHTFFVSVGDDFRTSLKQSIGQNESAALAQADEILRGRFGLFGTEGYDLGYPPAWGSFAPMDGGKPHSSVEVDRHWSQYDEGSFSTDVKLLWEPARFGWIFPLVRAYCLSGEVRYAEAIWTLIESWRVNNPPNSGPHWISAQEAAIRLLTMIFAMHVTFPRLAETPERLCGMAQMIAVHAARIPPTLIYARAQGNNHLLVEALALYTAGTLFPEFRQASAWRKLGRRWLERALRRQIFPDGGYVQHSTNYHRLALQASLWAARLAEVNGEPLPSKTLRALKNSARCLASMIDPQSGRAPNIGPNDGALIFPLSTCSFEDHRPTCQAAALAFLNQKRFAPGPWDEELLWFGFGSGESRTSAVVDGPTQERVGRSALETTHSFPNGGFYILRGASAWGVLRCVRFRSRPGHSDQLHFDLWWRGRNIACDPGTYLYSGQPPWNNPWIGASAHNTLLIDDREPMLRAGRFLWVDWAQGNFLGRWRSKDGGVEVVVAEHRGYARMGIVHRRAAARIGDDLWLLVDDLDGRGAHTVTQSWLTPDSPWEFEEGRLSIDLGETNVDVHLEGPHGDLGLYRAGTLVAGTEIEANPVVFGWRAQTYAVKQPALRLTKRFKASLPMRCCTRWAFADVNVDELEVDWSEPGRSVVPFSGIKWRDYRLEMDDAHFVDSSSLRRTG